MKLKETMISISRMVDKKMYNVDVSSYKNLYIIKKIIDIIDTINVSAPLDTDEDFKNGIIPILKLLPNRKCYLQVEKWENFSHRWEKENNVVNIVHRGIVLDYVVTYNFNFDLQNNTLTCGFQNPNQIGEELHNHFRIMGYIDYHEFMKEMLLFNVIKPLLFIELSKDRVKLIELKPKESHGNLLKGTELRNFTDITITKVDSLWNQFTFGVGDYKVRGHLRLQRCGVKLSETKLIFIDEYVKHQYIRRSNRELTFNNN